MFWLGYAAGFSDGVIFVAGIIAVLLAIVYVAYRASDGWSRK